MNVQNVTARKCGDEVLDRLEELWPALRTRHQPVEPDWSYFREDRSWTVRRRAYEQWILDEGSFVLLAERGGHAIGYAFVHIQPGRTTSG
ncbi:hypothetical protein [Streptomyces gobiensis]|uniref:hypothetical protein n=1 Tax=Streptomyces gobiensis TaxID=2875706 RepID=UPI001E4BA4C1|nr:hypothetical protein [Streptomyces gobiensis]UGY93862.1 hypothetical protein test1122_20515 [Streptomyces gobiensis]